MDGQVIRGIIASQGIQIGKAYLHRGKDLVVPRYTIPESWVEDELKRFERSVDKTKQDITDSQSQISHILSSDMADIFSSHLLVLEDPQIIEKTREGIVNQRRNAEWVINDISIELMESLRSIEDDYLRERIIDISDINRRLISNLQKSEDHSLADISEEVILVAQDLTPSETAVMDKNLIKAFVTDRGGKTSHTAIMARSLQIPAIIGSQEATSVIKSGDTVIVDAIHGQVIVNPSDEDLEKYHQMRATFERIETELAELRDIPVTTLDGTDITLLGNIEIPEEMTSISEHNAHGIGLFRSEFLFLDQSLPDEETQFEAYTRVAEHFSPLPVTIRTLDVGGDKISAYTGPHDEKNPFLGCRAIRFSLEHEDLFATQLRAIARASKTGNISVMFPMVSTVEELIRAREMFNVILQQVRDEGYDVADHVPMGIMVEVPSAALTIDLMAKYADFFSIGTNDLVQYVLAVDRISEKIAYLYNPLNPAVLRTLKYIVTEGNKTGKPISICGEIAGDFRYTMLLLGLGFRTLSMSPAYIYQVKKIITSVTIGQCEELVDDLLQYDMADTIGKKLDTLLREKFPEIFY